jgi:hypothetical protein
MFLGKKNWMNRAETPNFAHPVHICNFSFYLFICHTRTCLIIVNYPAKLGDLKNLKFFRDM